MAARLRIPAEWELHRCCWLAYPHLDAEWPDLDAAQRSVAEVCRTLAVDGNEPVRLLVRDDALASKAASRIGGEGDVEYLRATYGDCWTRDTLPLFGDTDGRLGALQFRFNGWGGKFDMEGDDAIGAWLVARRHAEPVIVDLTLEGGALEFDGEGTCIVTESCVLNPNRNPGLTRAVFEQSMRMATEVTRVVWLTEGLHHDHTDGHVDMVARFAKPGVVLCGRAEAGPNTEVLHQVETELANQGLAVLPLPTPGVIPGPDGAPLPANYCNFYVANEAVLVPQYDVDQDAEALAVIGKAFPERRAIGLPARDLLCGGGSFHCITQPEPMTP